MTHGLRSRCSISIGLVYIIDCYPMLILMKADGRGVKRAKILGVEAFQSTDRLMRTVEVLKEMQREACWVRLPFSWPSHLLQLWEVTMLFYSTSFLHLSNR